MPYLLPCSQFHLSAIATIREQYQATKKVNLNESHWFGVPTFLGGTDVISRHKQITFLEQIHFICSEFLKPLKEFASATLYEKNLHYRALLFFITACRFVQSQTGHRALLHQLIDDYLGVHSHNFMDENELHSFSLLALELLNEINLETINDKLRVANKNPIDPTQWQQFIQSLKTQATILPNKEYLIGNLLAPAIGKIGYTLGFGLGFGMGTLLSNPTFLLPSYLYLIALLTKASKGSRVASLFIPGLSATLIQGCIMASCAQTAALVFGQLGEKTGHLIGMPVDLITKTAKIAYNNALHASTPTLATEGFHVLQGRLLIEEETHSFEILPIELFQLQRKVLLLQYPQRLLLEAPKTSELESVSI